MREEQREIRWGRLWCYTGHGCSCYKERREFEYYPHYDGYDDDDDEYID